MGFWNDAASGFAGGLNSQRRINPDNLLGQGAGDYERAGLLGRMFGGQGSNFEHKGGMVNPMNIADILKAIYKKKNGSNINQNVDQMVMGGSNETPQMPTLDPMSGINPGLNYSPMNYNPNQMYSM